MKTIMDYPTPTQSEIERIEEIKFYLFTTKITKLARGAGLEEEYDILKHIFEALHLDEHLMYAAISTINSIACRPLEMEVAVVCKYLKLPIKFIGQHIMHNRKFYTNCKEYLELRKESGPLQPKMPEQLTNIVIKFNTLFREKLSPIFNFLDTEIGYLEATESWDE